MKKFSLRRLHVAGGIVAALAVGLFVHSWVNAVETDRPLMEQKLDHAEKVLKGLTLRDFKLLEEGSKGLVEISQWDQLIHFVTSDEDYNRSAEEFAYAAEKLVKAVEKEDIKGATMHFMQVTMNCVECHEMLRD